jgi:hypothetical protein
MDMPMARPLLLLIPFGQLMLTQVVVIMAFGPLTDITTGQVRVTTHPTIVIMNSEMVAIITTIGAN